MSQLNTVLARVSGARRNLLRLLIASWLMANTMCLLMSSTAFLTLDFVRQISLKSYLGVWGGICLCLVFLMLLPPNARRVRFPLAPSVSMYVAAVVIKGAMAL